MEIEFGGAIRPPGCGTCKVHSLESQGRDPLREGRRLGKRAEILYRFDRFRFELRSFAKRMEALKQIDLPMRMPRSRTLEPHAGPVPIAQPGPFDPRNGSWPMWRFGD